MLPARMLVRTAAVSLAVVATAAATATLALANAAPARASYSRHIVLGRNGQVVDHADPSLYLFDRTKRTAMPATHVPKSQESAPHEERKTQARQSQTRGVPTTSSKISIYQVTTDASAEHEPPPPATAPTSAPVSHDTLEVVLVYTSVPRDGPEVIFTEHVELRGDHDGLFGRSNEEIDYDEFSNTPPALAAAGPEQLGQVLEVPEVTIEQSELFESALPGVPGSILFSEMSCLFVAFIGYLVHSIPLWSRFSRGQRWCLLVAFGAAVAYQVAAVSWYFDLVSPEVMIGLSSLITRMISLGMVPITTTSFIGRAREACSEQELLNQTTHAALPSSSSGSGRHTRRHQHPRARAS